MKFFKELNLILNWSFVFYLTMFGYRIINPFLAKFRSQIRAKGWKMKRPKEKLGLGFGLHFLGRKGAEELTGKFQHSQEWFHYRDR